MNSHKMSEGDFGGVLMIDDHPIVQIGLASLLKRQKLFSQIDVAKNGKEAIAFVKKQGGVSDKSQKYHLVITDVMLPDYDITTLISRIKELLPDVPVLVFTMASTGLYFKTLVRLGVSGFLKKSVDEDELSYALKVVLRGGKHFSGDLISEAMFVGKENALLLDMFTKREREILPLLLRGVSSKEIAEKVNLHKSSVATYKARIFHKIGVDNSMELYQWASKSNLIESD